MYLALHLRHVDVVRAALAAGGSAVCWRRLVRRLQRSRDLFDVRAEPVADVRGVCGGVPNVRLDATGHLLLAELL
jgi:hypothetical protein